MFDLPALLVAAKQIGVTFDIPAIVLCATTAFYVLVLIRWHMSEKVFDFRTALFDTPVPGSVSLSRLGQLTALYVSTEILIYVTIRDGKPPEWMFAAYMTIWAGAYIASKFSPKTLATPDVPK